MATAPIRGRSDVQAMTTTTTKSQSRFAQSFDARRSLYSQTLDAQLFLPMAANHCITQSASVLARQCRALLASDSQKTKERGDERDRSLANV
ncbi:Uncharacterized protein APZ42_032174 [Daphnia magna]|uniref:Uncharacterized protein n=1 Tax=Daphnia magna TaxID=35525 RepID=A0A162D9Y9_9CRUS|nr:Uncharacterized protein APZ42_032174 [Daphnia magna]